MKDKLKMLAEINSVESLPTVISEIYYQPTTGFWFKDAEQIAITNMVIADITNLQNIILLENSSKEVIKRAVVNNDTDTQNNFEYVQQQFEDEGFTIYKANSFRFAALVKYKSVKISKGSITEIGDEKTTPAIVNINSSTQISKEALNSMVELLLNSVDVNQSISSINVVPVVSDEPFITKNKSRKIYKVSFVKTGKTVESDIDALISKTHSNTQLIRILIDKLRIETTVNLTKLNDFSKVAGIELDNN